MPTIIPKDPARRRTLIVDVQRARVALDDARCQHPAAPPSLTSNARHDLVTALVAYTEWLRADGAPVPYALRDELRLQAGLDRPDARRWDDR